MAENPKSCVICGGTESEGELLLAAPCGRHFVCHDDISSFFERATQDESLFPPQCCGQIFALEDYEDYVPFDISWAYQVKEQGEYAVLAKFRVYCASPICAKFLPPRAHIKDEDTNITYAVCEGGACGSVSCVGCRALIKHSVQSHVCQKDEEEEKFRQIAIEKGYQACNICGATVELIEACNHITCGCGHDFCYICGKDWQGVHGCPHYGPATYDEEDYNQEGYHRDTGLNREGLTRRQENMRRREEDGDDDDEEDRDEEDEEDNEEDDDPDWEVLQHLTPDQRVVVNTLHGVAREDALDQLRITLFETRGIMFGNQDPPQVIHPDEEDEDGEGEREGELQDEDEDENLDENLDEEVGEHLGAGNEVLGDQPDEQGGLVGEDILSDHEETRGQDTEAALAGSPADPDPSHDAQEPTHERTRYPFTISSEFQGDQANGLDSSDQTDGYETTNDNLNLHMSTPPRRNPTLPASPPSPWGLVFSPRTYVSGFTPPPPQHSPPSATTPTRDSQQFDFATRVRELQEGARRVQRSLRDAMDAAQSFESGTDARDGNAAVGTGSTGQEEGQQNQEDHSHQEVLGRKPSDATSELPHTSPFGAGPYMRREEDQQHQDEGSRSSSASEDLRRAYPNFLSGQKYIPGDDTGTMTTATAAETVNRQISGPPGKWPEWDDAEI
ncbi:hypothetical protein FB567DRAFT_287853 [Paraphoma chrysanthemicola]|uniref:RING-type domain-containing protein n=1 Tax=Paraphoma chrysanthemicola TaxID=798071 RepID=A0A8K0RAG0_9PLEO|nr:hypothetical protein FB567DRAFT_287853 [Paraphoma chrysanthemicola]